MIPEIMWAYQTTTKMGSRFAPFTLAFRIEVAAPIELIWPTACTTNYDEEGNEEALITLQ